MDIYQSFYMLFVSKTHLFFRLTILVKLPTSRILTLACMNVSPFIFSSLLKQASKSMTSSLTVLNYILFQITYDNTPHSGRISVKLDQTHTIDTTCTNQIRENTKGSINISITSSHNKQLKTTIRKIITWRRSLDSGAWVRVCIKDEFSCNLDLDLPTKSAICFGWSNSFINIVLFPYSRIPRPHASFRQC